MAKMHLLKQHGIETINPHMRNEAMFVTHQGTKLSHFDIRRIYDTLQIIPTFEYWERKHAIPRRITTAIDWTTVGKAYSALPLSKQRRVTKHASGHCGTGRMELIRGNQPHSKCPRCDCDNEDTQHILRCNDARARHQWTEAIQAFQQWLIDQDTEPTLRDLIINGIND